MTTVKVTPCEQNTVFALQYVTSPPTPPDGTAARSEFCTNYSYQNTEYQKYGSCEICICEEFHDALSWHFKVLGQC